MQIVFSKKGKVVLNNLVLVLMILTIVNITFAQSIQYVYDSLNRVVEVRYPSKVIRYTYDEAGNRSSLTVENLTTSPSITNITPNSAIVGGNGFILTVNGNNFVSDSVVQWNGITHPTTFVNSNQLTSIISSGDIAAIGSVPVTVFNPATNTVSNTQIFSVKSGSASCISLSIPNNLNAQPNTTITIPIAVGELSNAGVEAYDFTLLFDPSIIVPSITPVDINGTLSSSMSVLANSPQPGKLIVSAAGTNYLTGQGTLLNLRFDVVGAPQSNSPISWQQFQFGDNLPCADVANGQITVGNPTYSIGGTVSYANTPANQSTKFVRGVTLTATGTMNSNATTNLSGNYNFANLGVGNYTIMPSKSGDINGISSLDASRIQQYLVGLTTLTPNQLIAADANNSGTVTSLDASRIQQYLVGIQSTNIIGQWKFVPGVRQYNSVTSNLTSENYQAVLVGEVSGNWAAPTGFAEFSELNNGLINLSKNSSGSGTVLSKIGGIAVNLPPDAMASNGTLVTIPITVGDLTGSVIESFDFAVFYDPAVLQPASPVGSNIGTLSANCSVLANSPLAGRVVVSGSCGNPPITGGQGALYNLRFNVIGSGNQQTTLSFVNPQTSQNTFQFNDGDPQAVTSNGNFTVIPVTAATARVSGRILTATGKAIQNAQIRLTDANGNSRITNSSSLGYYEFNEIQTGEAYVINISAKQYSFNPSTRIINVFDSVANLNFVADP